jgi:hypothetical protein
MSRHWLLSHVISFYFQPNLFSINLILPSHLRLGLPNCFLLQVIQQQFYTQFRPYHSCYMPPLHPHRTNWWTVNISKWFSVKFSLIPYHFFPLGRKQTIQHSTPPSLYPCSSTQSNSAPHACNDSYITFWHVLSYCFGRPKRRRRTRIGAETNVELDKWDENGGVWNLNQSTDPTASGKSL